MADTDRLTAITARVEKATPGPWERADGREWLDEYTVFGPSTAWSGHIAHVASVELGQNKDADAEFIANARSDVPWLLEQLSLSAARIAQLEAAMAKLDELHQPFECNNLRCSNVEGKGLHCYAGCETPVGPDKWPCDTRSIVDAVLERKEQHG